MDTHRAQGLADIREVARCASGANATLGETTKELWPFFGVAMVVLLLMSYVPALTIY